MKRMYAAAGVLAAAMTATPGACGPTGPVGPASYSPSYSCNVSGSTLTMTAKNNYTRQSLTINGVVYDSTNGLGDDHQSSTGYSDPSGWITLAILPGHTVSINLRGYWKYPTACAIDKVYKTTNPVPKATS